MKKFGVFLLWMLLMPFSALFQAWVLSVIWGWFLAPQYGGGPSYAAWCGISSTCAVLGMAIITSRPNDDRPIWVKFFTHVGGLLVLLGLAGVVRFAFTWMGL